VRTKKKRRDDVYALPKSGGLPDEMIWDSISIDTLRRLSVKASSFDSFAVKQTTIYRQFYD